MELVVRTIGHSTHSTEDLIGILKAHSIQTLVDVRTAPRSRHAPQFNKDAIGSVLDDAAIRYVHMKELGGWRRARGESPNTGWRSSGFRGYADYMLTAAFDAAVSQLIDLAQSERVAIMCAEAVPWRCHRSLIADALTARGVEVRHIMGSGPADVHKLTSFAKVDGARITYPAPSQSPARLPLDMPQ